MGNGIAHTFAQNNYNVNLVDISEDALNKALLTIEKNLKRMVSKEKISEEEKENTLNNITTHKNMSKGVEKADLVIEAATENLDLKLKIFKQLDKICNEKTLLATNTSSISISQIASITNRPSKVIGMHFMSR